MINWKEVLSRSSPIFKVDSADIIDAFEVDTRTSKSSFEPRVFIISIPGLYVLQKKTFPRGYAIKQILPMSELMKIIIVSGQTRFIGQNTQIDIQSDKFIQIAFTANVVYSELFAGLTTSFSFSYPDSMYERVNMINFCWTSPSPFIHRLMGFASARNYPINPIDPVWASFRNTTSTLTIDDGVMLSPLLPEVTTCILLDSTITHLKFRDFDFAIFMPYFQIILAKNTNVSEVSFKQIKFSKDPSFLLESYKFSIFNAVDITFEKCDFEDLSFLRFFRAFCQYPRKILNFSMVQNNFSVQSITATFHTIVNSPCFSELSTLHIDQTGTVNIIPLLLYQEWAIKSRSLRSLTIIDRELELSESLPMLVANSFGLQILTFVRCKVEKLMPAFMSFQAIQKFVLSDLCCEGNCLISLFRVLSECKQPPNHLVINGPLLDSEGMRILYQSLPSITFPQLRSLSWVRLQMNNDECIQFVRFLKNIPCLADLDISLSLAMEEANYSLETLRSFLKSRNLQKFAISGCGKLRFGPNLNSLLRVVCSTKTIKSLDITSQSIGTYEVIRDFVNSGLEELWWDGSTPKTFADFVEFCNFLIDSPLKLTQWPEIDADYVLRIPTKRVTYVSQTIETLKNRFQARFNNISISGQWIDRTVPPLPPKSPKLERRLSKKLSIITSDPFALEIIMDRDKLVLQKRRNDTAQLLKEIFHVQELPEPLTVEWERLEFETKTSVVPVVL